MITDVRITRELRQFIKKKYHTPARPVCQQWPWCVAYALPGTTVCAVHRMYKGWGPRGQTKKQYNELTDYSTGKLRKHL